MRPQEPVVPKAPEGTGPPGRPGTAGPSDWSGVAAAFRALRASVPRFWGGMGSRYRVGLHLAAPDGRGCPETETVNGGAELPGGAAEPSQGGAAPQLFLLQGSPVELTLSPGEGLGAPCPLLVRPREVNPREHVCATGVGSREMSLCDTEVKLTYRIVFVCSD